MNLGQTKFVWDSPLSYRFHVAPLSSLDIPTRAVRASTVDKIVSRTGQPGTSRTAQNSFERS